MISSCTLVAVQMKIGLEQFASQQAFEQKIFSVLQLIEKQVPKHEAALVVFPEDIGLGLLFTQDYSLVRNCKSVLEVALIAAQKHHKEIARIQEEARGQGGRTYPLARALCRILSPETERIYRTVFSQAAKHFGWWVVAGSAPIAQHEHVYNTTYSFNPKGEVVNEQRKVRLVPQEGTDGLALSEAPADKLSVFKTPFGTVGVLICYDAFFPELVEQIVKAGAKIIVQPSFNLPPWTEEEKKEWETGLLSAVQRHKGVIGVNPMMVGCLFDLCPSGQSGIMAHVDLTPDRSGYLARAKTSDQEEILIVKT